MENTLVMDNPVCFQLKTSFAPCTILQILHYDLKTLAYQIEHAVKKAPNFFLGSPVIIDLEKIKHLFDIEFVNLRKVLISCNLVPIGVRGGSDEQHQLAATAGIPLITVGQGKPIVVEEPKPEKKQEDKIVQSIKQYTKLITSPIRSGMSVYAKDSDLIVVAPVSAGAELLADGNIHVYGPLRGRALAGVQGDMQARIFCRKLEAELVAIAGYYLVKDDIKRLPVQNSAVQVFLESEQVKIETL